MKTQKPTAKRKTRRQVRAVVHTPAPWRVVRSLTCGHLRAAHNYQKNPKREWTDADLRLIEASPVLLAAAVDVLSYLTDAPQTLSAGQRLDAILKLKRAIELSRVV